MIESARSTDCTPPSRASGSPSALDFGSMALRRITSLFIATCIHGSDCQRVIRPLLPLPVLHGERVGVRGCLRKFERCECAESPLTRIASAMRSDLSPQAGRGDRPSTVPLRISEAAFAVDKNQSRPAPRAHLYLAPSTSTGSSVEYA